MSGINIKKADFNSSIFGAQFKLIRAKFTEASFRNIVLDAPMLLKHAEIYGVSFRDSPIEMMNFIDCKWRSSKGRKTIAEMLQHNKKDAQSSRKLP